MITNEMLIISILSAITLVSIIWLIRIELRLKKLLGGSSARDLESVIVSLVEKTAALQKNDAKIEQAFAHIDNRLRKSIQGVETVRFNPFKDSGGNHSFATALISEDGDGVVISSLYARDRVNIFAKPIKKHVSDFELTAEERDVLARAKK